MNPSIYGNISENNYTLCLVCLILTSQIVLFLPSTTVLSCSKDVVLVLSISQGRDSQMNFLIDEDGHFIVGKQQRTKGTDIEVSNSR